MADDLLYYGDNLEVLRRHIPDESVDLIYLDPPFKSNQNYNVLFEEKDGSQAAAQIKAFEDTWQWDAGSAAAYHEIVEKGPHSVSRAMQAFRELIGCNDMLAYLSMMAPRLVELRRVLKKTGSIYLHCDPTASHYLKLLMDAVFGPRAFRNEIVWKRYGAHNDHGQGSRHFGRVHDILLFYTASGKPTWNQQFTPLDPEYVEKNYGKVEEATGRRYMTKPLTAPGGAAKGNPVYEWNGHTRSWRYSKERMQELHNAGRLYYSRTGYVRQKHYLDESKGVPAQDVWLDIPSLSGQHAERLGYPTQKPEALLERIIRTSSDKGDVVLDPFCGCGTTIAAAQKLARRWIGIDVTHQAIHLIKNRLLDTFKGKISFEVHGEPVAPTDAEALAKYDPHEFQAWALGLVGARRDDSNKKGADQGIDGRLYFHDGNGKGKTKKIILSVKAGKLKMEHVRDLRGVIEREGAQIGVLLSLKEPTNAMRKEAASAGFYDSPWGSHPRMQLLTVGEIMENGTGIDYPARRQTNVTYRPARGQEKKVAEVLSLPFEEGAGVVVSYESD